MYDASQDPGFNGAIGFNRDDVADAIDNCCAGYTNGTAGHAAIVDALAQRWGGGYLFHDYLLAGDGMFSPAMVADVLRVVNGVQAADNLTNVLAEWKSSLLPVEPNRVIVTYLLCARSRPHPAPETPDRRAKHRGAPNGGIS